MKKLHLALSTNNLADSVAEYSKRLDCEPEVVVDGEYALWRNPFLNLSVRVDSGTRPGSLRHLGWEDPDAREFTTDIDVNGIVWESFTAEQQADEINEFWPGTGYTVREDV